MLQRLIDWWKARQRSIDIEVLWPVCKENASDIDVARGAFFLHTKLDAAWSNLSDDEIIEIIEALP